MLERGDGDEGVGKGQFAGLAQGDRTVGDGIRDREHQPGGKERFEIGLVLRRQAVPTEDFDAGGLRDGEGPGENLRARNQPFAGWVA